MGIGGTDPGSILNQGQTPGSEAKAGNSGNQTMQVTTVFPTLGYVPPPDKDVIGTFLSDWYRDGKPSATGDGTFDIVPKTFTEFEEAPAAIHVFAYDAKKKKDVELIPRYTKMIIESVTEMHQERSQIVETFGDFYVFLFGERPPMYNFAGTLINSKNANWVSDFKFYYDNYLRGSKCVENNARLVITYGGRQVEGFMLSQQNSTEASVEGGVKFSFPLVVTKKSFIGFSDDFGMVTTLGGATLVDKKYKDMLDKIAGSEGVGMAEKLASSVFNATKNAMVGGPASAVISATA